MALETGQLLLSAEPSKRPQKKTQAHRALLLAKPTKTAGTNNTDFDPPRKKEHYNVLQSARERFYGTTVATKKGLQRLPRRGLEDEA